MNHLVSADELQAVRFSGHKPRKTHPGDAGFDLISDDPLAHMIQPGDRVLIRTGTAVALPWWTVGLICSRSGMARHHGVHVLNAPGIIDPGYRGEIGVVLHNAGREPFMVCTGDRIAQLIIVPTLRVVFEYDEDFTDEDTARGSDGFGSTGTAS